MIIKGETRHASSVELGPVLNTSRKKLSTPPKSVLGPYFKICTLLLVFLSSVLLLNSYTINSVTVNPSNATIENDLICTWDITGSTTQVNVTWYNGSNVYITVVGASGSSHQINSNIAKKNQVWNCTISVRNSSTSSIDSDKVTILNANPEPPDLDSYQELLEDNPWTHNLGSTDPDNDPLSYFCNPSSVLDTCNPITGALAWTPISTDVGLYNVSIFILDDDDGVSVKKVTFNVTAVNDRPTISVSNQTMYENSTLQYEIDVDDEEDSTGPFTFSMNSTYSPERLNATTSDYDTFTIQFINNGKALFGDKGNYTVYVEACDPDNSSLCVNANFELEVIPLNQIPVLHPIPNITGNQTKLYTLQFNASDADDTDSLTFSVSTIDCSINPWSITHLNTSNNGSAMINLTLNNSHIVCSNITISVTDGNYIVDQDMFLNLTNVNDAPVLYNLSYYGDNTQNNTDIRNISGFIDVQLIYKVNGTDVDSFTYEGENLTYADNSSQCGTNCPSLNMSSSGIIAMVPNTTYLGTYTYEVNVTDDSGLYATGILTITIANNTPPDFYPALQDQIANESVLFVYDINATDDQNDTISYADNSSLFVISSSGLINFTPSCSNIGNHSIKITLTDSVGAERQDTFNLEITNKPDAPILPLVYNETILETFPYYLDIGTSTTDGDITCGQADSLTYGSEFIIGSELFIIDSAGVISFTPNSSSSGGYLINISVTDTFGFSDYLFLNLTIINLSQAPVINNITPYNTPTIFDWIDLSTLGADYTTINVSENTTIVYDHNSTDPDGQQLVFNWTLSGNVIGSEKNQSYTWDFDDSGTHNITLTVSDNVSNVLAHWVSFSWLTVVGNFNRAPEINDSLPNVTVNGTLTLGGYLTGQGWQYVGFYDPDGDTLTYTHSSVSNVTITISGADVTFAGSAIGNYTVVFTASDGSLNVSSNNITIMVSQVQEVEKEETEGGIGRSSSSGGSTAVPYSIIQEVEKEVQVYLDIIVPETITIYKNDTLRQVISLVNSGNLTLRGIYVSAQTNNSDAEISFSNDYFAELLPGETEKTDLIITSYKLLNHYEIIIWANVTEPEYKDKAVIYVNAIEKSRGNQSVTATKITFARDLLSSNPECLELNEFIIQAQFYIDRGDYDRASQILDSVIQGCKYLVSQSKLRDESPKGLLFNIGKVPYLIPALIAFAVIVVIIAVLTYRTKKANDQLV